jgi:hypothetical protein
VPSYRSPDNHSATAETVDAWIHRYGKQAVEIFTHDDDCLCAQMQWSSGVEELVFVAWRAADGVFAPLIVYR